MNTQRHQPNQSGQTDREASTSNDDLLRAELSEASRRIAARRMRPLTTTVRLDPQTYSVTCVPKSVPRWWAWALRVEDHGHGRWAVVNARGEHLSRGGRRDVDPAPPDRPPGWLAAHRFDLADVLRRAARTAPTTAIDGVLPADAIAAAQAGTAQAGTEHGSRR